MVTQGDDIWIPTPEELAERVEADAGARSLAGRRRQPVRGRMQVRRSATGTPGDKSEEPRER